MRICFIGDSLTVGTGDETGVGWVGHLVASLRLGAPRLTAYNLGVRGDTTRDVRKRWRREAAPRLPVIEPGGLVFAMGLNDCIRIGGVRKVRRQDTPRHIGHIVDAVVPWRPSLFLGPLPVRDGSVLPSGIPGVPATVDNLELAELADLLRDSCERVGAPYLDLFGEFSGSSEWLSGLDGGDGVHPRASGYQAMAERVRTSAAWQTFLDQLAD